MKPFTPVLVSAVFLYPLLVFGQPAPATPAEPSANAQSAASSSNAKSRNKEKPLPTFLIIGTVFNEKAISFPGVDVRIRRSNEKKYRWHTETNSRGEFAVRVPPGYDYEVAVHAKNYRDQTKTVDGKADVQQRLSIELVPMKENQGKAGAKP